MNFAALDRAGAAARIRLDSTAVWVKHDGEPAKSEFVTVAYTRGGKTYRVRARSVVMAGGSWTTRHIVRDLPPDRVAAYSQFYRTPCMMANVAVRNWRFLYKMGISGCQWFEGLGNYMQVRKLATLWRRRAHDRTGFADRALHQGFVFLSRAIHRAAGTHGTRGVDFDSVSRLRTADSPAVHRHVRPFWIRRRARHCRNHPEPLGTRVFEPGSRILFRQRWASPRLATCCGRRPSAESPSRTRIFPEWPITGLRLSKRIGQWGSCWIRFA